MQRNARGASRAAGAVGILFALVLEGLGGGATALAQPVQDHLKCYQLRFPPGFRFTPVTRDIDDQFGLQQGCTILKPRELCVPATKTPSAPPAGVPVGHFVRYQLKCPRFASQSVAVSDQFFQQTVTVQKPVALLVPAEEELVTALQAGRFQGRILELTEAGARTLLAWVGRSLGPHAADAQGGLRDHLKCYRIRLPSGFRFTPVDRAVDDEFGHQDPVTFKKPKELCVPAEKIPGGSPQGSAAGRMVCYQGGFPAFTRRDVTVTDQFLSQQRVTVAKPRRACTPGEPAPTTTTTTASSTTTSVTTASSTTTTSATTSTTTTTQPIGTCGDGTIDPGEMCDPPHQQGVCPAGEYCNDTCTACQGLCGDGIVAPDEACDRRPGESLGCPAGQSCKYDCSTCQLVCGDGVIGQGEVCDPPGSTGATGGCPVGVCTQDCSACCGDGVVGPGEACEPPGEQDLQHCSPDAPFCNAQCTGCQSTPPDTCGDPSPECTQLCGTGTCVLSCGLCGLVGGGGPRPCCRCLCVDS